MSLDKQDWIAAVEEISNARYVDNVRGGHTDSLIARFARGEEKLIAKSPLSASIEQISHVAGNIVGYNALCELGAKSMVPDIYQVYCVLGVPCIILSDLGDNCTSVIRKKILHAKRAVEIVLKAYSEVCGRTKREASRSGLGELAATQFTQSINRFSLPLIATFRGLFPRDIIELIYVAYPRSRYITLSLLDFTPDNVFVESEVIRFVDPWQQLTYLGNPGISVGQFLTLCDIYGFLEDDALPTLCQDAANNLVTATGITESQITTGILLGQVLQYMLSSFVRIASDRKMARHFATRAMQALERLVKA